MMSPGLDPACRHGRAADASVARSGTEMRSFPTIDTRLLFAHSYHRRTIRSSASARDRFAGVISAASALAFAALATLSAPSPTRTPAPETAAVALSAVNTARGNSGSAPLSGNATLDRVAQASAERVANARTVDDA